MNQSNTCRRKEGEVEVNGVKQEESATGAHRFNFELTWRLDSQGTEANHLFLLRTNDQHQFLQ